MSIPFQLVSPFLPAGDQPAAIEKLVTGFTAGQNRQVLLGVTGSGKTFTAAHVIAKLGKPTLVLSHNKTLAAQLYKEFKSFFPHNAVHYFISYYDYYQPEAYIPQRDIYIEKDSAIERGRFRVRGDVIELWPAYEEFALRVELFGDEVESLAIINPTTGETA